MCMDCGHQRWTTSLPPPDPAESDPDYYDESDLTDPADEYPNTIETASPWGDRAPLWGDLGSGDRRS